MEAKNPPRIPLPEAGTKHARVAMLHVVAPAQYATMYTRGWASNSLNGRVRLKAGNERLRQELALLREEIRIKDARLMLITPQRRPTIPPSRGCPSSSGERPADGHSNKPRTHFW
jgi:hypothetical protein